MVGSKFEGTGFEKEHIGQIHVAELAGVGSGVGRWNPPSALDKGEAVVLLEGLLKPDTMRFWTDDRLEGFGTRVIFAEDFRKPAYCNVSNKNNNRHVHVKPSLHRIHSGQRLSDRLQRSSCVGRHGRHSIYGAMSGTLNHFGGLGFCISCYLVSLSCLGSFVCGEGADSPFVEPDIILDEEEDFIR